MKNLKKILEDITQSHTSSINTISNQTLTINKIVQILVTARKKGNTVYVMGNGGSGSTASHFVSDLLKTSITKNSKRFKAISMVDNIPVTLAWANDTSYEDIFFQQLENFISKNDIVIAFSGSGKSSNIIKAIKYAKKKNAICIGFSGMGGGHMKKLCNVCFVADDNNMLSIESIHLVVCHIIIDSIRKLGKPIFNYD